MLTLNPELGSATWGQREKPMWLLAVISGALLAPKKIAGKLEPAGEVEAIIITKIPPLLTPS